LSEKVNKERKLIEIKHIKENIKKEKEKGLGLGMGINNHSASNIIGGLTNGIGNEKGDKPKPFSYKKKKI